MITIPRLRRLAGQGEEDVSEGDLLVVVLGLDPCSLTAPAATSANRSAARSAIAESPALPGVRSGVVVAIWRAVATAAAPSKVPGGPAGSSGAGAPSSENMPAITAISVGRNARR